MLTRAESFLVAAVSTAALAGIVSSTYADQDLWGHITFGHEILRQFAIPRIDSYSFTSDRQWINHEWLAEILMYGAYAMAGGFGLNVLKALVCAATGAIVVWWLNRHRMPFETRALLFVVAILGTKAQTGHVRPQLFSVLLFAVLLPLLEFVAQRKVLAIIALPALMLVWANLHGGWIIGVGTIAIWCSLLLLQSKRTARERVTYFAVATAAVLATALNPYGFGLWKFVAETVRLERLEITDWQPVMSAPDNFVVWMVTAAACVGTLIVRRRRPSIFSAALLLALGAASFRVLRLEAFFALSSVLLLASELGRGQSVDAGAESPPASRAAVYTVVGASSCIMLGAGLLVAVNVSCITIDPARLPEPAAVAFVQQRHLSGHMVTWFDWGEYAIWHLSPNIRVSLDGRRETVYSPEMLAWHLNFYNSRRLEELHWPTGAEPDLIWLPRALPVVAALRSAGWQPIFDGAQSVIFAQPDWVKDAPATAGLGTARCFPGP